jgi:Tol biopolymer transport system component
VRFVAGGVLLLASASSLWAQAKRPMAWVDAQRLRSVSGAALSPDGAQLLYALTTPDWKEATTQSDLYMVRTDRGLASTRQLTFTKDKNESSPRWAPAGGWFVFSSNREGTAGDSKTQLFLMRPDGGEARRITNAKEGVSTFAFSKDGQWLVYRSGKATEEQLYAVAMTALDRGTPLDSLAPLQLTKHPTGVGSWELAPDSRRLYFITADTVDADEKARMEKKFTVAVRNAETSINSLWMVDLSSASRPTTRVTRDTSLAVTAFVIAPDSK